PNVRATLLPLVEGLEAVSVNCWPSVGFDLGALTGACAAFLPAGFYYKTFMWPSWRVFEPAIRGMAGLGQAPALPDPDHSEGAADLPECVLRERLWKIRARAVIAAAGAFERPLLFPNNDRPGVMLAGAAAKYAFGFGVACGERAVIAANSDSAYEVGALLAALGIEIAAIVDRREGAAPSAAPVGGAGRSDAVTRAPSGRGKQFVDVQNDVTAADVALAARESYRSVEHLKRYTTTGMGTDQGKTSNINALILMGGYTGQDPPEVGTTRFRPPFAPVTLGAIAGRRVGRLYRPLKRLPAHDWHAARGALFETFGDWSRPAAYRQAGETLEAAAQREAGTVRKRAGLFDGSPLGKLEVFGPDAARFLDLMYVGTMSTLKTGQ